MVDPNVMDLVVVTLELNIPVVNTNPFSANVPLVKVTVPVAVIVKALAKLVVPVRLSMVNAGSVVLNIDLTCSNEACKPLQAKAWSGGIICRS